MYGHCPRRLVITGTMVNLCDSPPILWGSGRFGGNFSPIHPHFHLRSYLTRNISGLPIKSSSNTIQSPVLTRRPYLSLSTIPSPSRPPAARVLGYCATHQSHSAPIQAKLHSPGASRRTMVMLPSDRRIPQSLGACPSLAGMLHTLRTSARFQQSHTAPC
jgi:hypothetical protein